MAENTYYNVNAAYEQVERIEYENEDIKPYQHMVAVHTAIQVQQIQVQQIARLLNMFILTPQMWSQRPVEQTRNMTR